MRKSLDFDAFPRAGEWIARYGVAVDWSPPGVERNPAWGARDAVAWSVAANGSVDLPSHAGASGERGDAP